MSAKAARKSDSSKSTPNDDPSLREVLELLQKIIKLVDQLSKALHETTTAVRSILGVINKLSIWIGIVGGLVVGLHFGKVFIDTANIAFSSFGSWWLNSSDGTKVMFIGVTVIAPTGQVLWFFAKRAILKRPRRRR